MIEEVVREQVLPADRETVWKALTEAEGLEAWLAEEAELDLEPGGEVCFRLRDGEERRGFVEEVAAPERLAFWWRPAGNEDAPLTRVGLTLSESEEGTLLRVVETMQPATVEAFLAPSTQRSSGPQLRAGGPLALVG